MPRTGSRRPRRHGTRPGRAQILHRRPDLRLLDIRGNVETRLRKLSEQNLDTIVLAQAGLERLGLAHVITELLDPAWMLPAVGQGALGLECRATDTATLTLLQQLDHASTRQAVLAERAFLRTLEGGCQVPIGALATVAADELTLRGAIVDPAGQRRLENRVIGGSHEPETLGRRLAEMLLAQGAGELLARSPA